MKKYLFALLAALIVNAGIAGAATKLSLSSLFTDNMVLQQQTEASIWGRGTPDETVSVTASWNGETVKAKVQEDGTWGLKIKTAGAGGPYELKTESAGETIIISNVMLGEVWICSGQSNMAMPVKGYTSQPVENSLRTILEAPKYSDRIRIFNIKRDSSSVSRTECNAVWTAASTESVSNASAIAYGFARRLTEALGDVPVGIVISAYGGTKIEAWTPAEALLPALEGKVSEKIIDKKLSAENLPGKKPQKIGTIYNAMINPIAGFSARGFIWYQGCSNRKDYSHYALMQTAMVASWRQAWRDSGSEMPFYFVTIAPHAYDDADGITRPLFVENQLQSLETIPNSHAIISEGFGAKDCIHPPYKFQIADQLAWNVLVNEYRFKGQPSGYPAYERHEIEGDKVIVYFSNSKNGLCPSYGEEVKGFMVAGKDGQFYPAHARVLSGPYRVEVRSGQVSAPVNVRYSFLNYMESNLTDLLGTPVPPFRTDRE